MCFYSLKLPKDNQIRVYKTEKVYSVFCAVCIRWSVNGQTEAETTASVSLSKAPKMPERDAMD